MACGVRVLEVLEVLGDRFSYAAALRVFRCVCVFCPVSFLWALGGESEGFVVLTQVCFSLSFGVLSHL